MRKNNDRMLLESLVRKYGKNGVKNAIRRINESIVGDFEIRNEVLIKYYGNGGNVTIPKSVTVIGISAFKNCISLKSVTIPDTVTVIGPAAFEGCTSLKSVTMPYSVRSIRESAFSGCSSLTDITIPNSVTEIREYAFEGCTSLVNINIPNEAEISKDAFKDTKIKNENENINDDFEQREVIYSVIYNALEDACLYLQKVGIEITEDVVRTGVDWFDLHNEFYEI